MKVIVFDIGGTIMEYRNADFGQDDTVMNLNGFWEAMK